MWEWLNMHANYCIGHIRDIKVRWQTLSHFFYNKRIFMTSKSLKEWTANYFFCFMPQKPGFYLRKLKWYVNSKCHKSWQTPKKPNSVMILVMKLKTHLQSNHKTDKSMPQFFSCIQVNRSPKDGTERLLQKNLIQ